MGIIRVAGSGVRLAWTSGNVAITSVFGYSPGISCGGQLVVSKSSGSYARDSTEKLARAERKVSLGDTILGGRAFAVLPQSTRTVFAPY